MESLQKQVLKHLEKVGKISTWEAIEKFHCTRLSAVIFELRKKGHNITTTDVYYQTKDGKLKKYGLYRLEKGDK